MATDSLDLQSRGIAHVLRDRKLAVPAYQRPYAWTEENVLDYWHDLKSSLDRGDSVYFLGAIVLASGMTDDRDLVIDGQQRLATTTLLIAAFRDAFLARGDATRAQVISDTYLRFFDLLHSEPQPRLLLSKQDGEYYESAIIDRVQIDPEVPSHRRLLTAYRLLVEQVESDVEDAAETRIDTWVRFLDRSVRVIAVDVPTEADAFLIFETLNDRGAPLTIADLLKTFLLSRSGDYFVDVEDAWASAVESLGDYEESPELVDFLRHYWSSHYGATRERDLYRALRDKLVDADDVMSLSKDIADESEIYAAMLDPVHPWWKRQAADASKSMDILLQLGLAQNRPLLLAVLAQFGPAEAERALRSLVSWSVRGILVGGIGGGRTERAYALAAMAVRGGRTTTAEGLFEHLRPIVPNDEEFRRSFETATLTRRRVAEYLIKALETSMSSSVAAPFVDSELVGDAWLHQVMPGRASAEGWPGFAPEEIPRESNRLGNFVLLDRSRRPRAPAWRDIKQVLDAQPYSTTSLAAQYNSWSPRNVRARQAQLADAAVSVWPREPVGE